MSVWLLLCGIVLLGVALTGSYVRRLPLSAAIIYLGIGLAIGSPAIHLIRPSLPESATGIQRIAELAIIISLSGSGLKLRIPLRDRRWIVPVRLAFVSMAVSILLLAVLGVAFLH